MTQLRIPFSDYPPEEQEKDLQRAKQIKMIRHAYLMKISGEWAHFIISQGGENIDFYEDMKLPEVCAKLKRKFPDYQPRVIMNEGLENYLRDQRPRIMRGRNKQLTINFNGGQNNER
ncbi:MAG: hypothetical protein IJ218_01630 [Alphaproteobacteria bacterium]|nr:hypothetical protein [Alphaproteobacteria bacterium]